MPTSDETLAPALPLDIAAERMLRGATARNGERRRIGVPDLLRHHQFTKREGWDREVRIDSAIVKIDRHERAEVPQ